MIGEGEVYQDGNRKKSSDVLAELSLAPIQLQAKEGLALLNGTQFSQAYGCCSLVKANRLLQLSMVISAASVEGFHCHTTPFNKLLHDVRPHYGQQFVAKQIRSLLMDSDLSEQTKMSVQDPYAFSCIPQVIGASIDAYLYAKRVFDRELNGTDNQPYFETDEILSGGNFHAQPLALAMDFLAIALAEVGNISERRLFQLISGQRGLPVYLSNNPGKESGVMIYNTQQLVLSAKISNIVAFIC